MCVSIHNVRAWEGYTMIVATMVQVVAFNYLDDGHTTLPRTFSFVSWAGTRTARAGWLVDWTPSDRAVETTNARSLVGLAAGPGTHPIASVRRRGAGLRTALGTTTARLSRPHVQLTSLWEPGAAHADAASRADAARASAPA